MSLPYMNGQEQMNLYNNAIVPPGITPNNNLEGFPVYSGKQNNSINQASHPNSINENEFDLLNMSDEVSTKEDHQNNFLISSTGRSTPLEQLQSILNRPASVGQASNHSSIGGGHYEGGSHHQDSIPHGLDQQQIQNRIINNMPQQLGQRLPHTGSHPDMQQLRQPASSVSQQMVLPPHPGNINPMQRPNQINQYHRIDSDIHSRPTFSTGMPTQPGIAPREGLSTQHGMPQQLGISHSRLGAYQGQPPQSGIGDMNRPQQPGMLSQSEIPTNPRVSAQFLRPIHQGLMIGMNAVPDIPQQSGMPSQPGMPKQSGLPSQTGMPPQSGLPSQTGMPPQSGMQFPPRMPQQSGLPSQPGMPPQLGMLSQPGMPQQSGIPPLPGMQLQSGIASESLLSTQHAMPPQSGNQSGLPAQLGMPPKTGMLSNFGIPSHPGAASQPIYQSKQFEGSQQQPRVQNPLGMHPPSGITPIQQHVSPLQGNLSIDNAMPFRPLMQHTLPQQNPSDNLIGITPKSGMPPQDSSKPSSQQNWPTQSGMPPPQLGSTSQHNMMPSTQQIIAGGISSQHSPLPNMPPQPIMTTQHRFPPPNRNGPSQSNMQHPPPGMIPPQQCIPPPPFQQNHSIPNQELPQSRFGPPMTGMPPDPFSAPLLQQNENSNLNNIRPQESTQPGFPLHNMPPRIGHPLPSNFGPPLPRSSMLQPPPIGVPLQNPFGGPATGSNIKSGLEPPIQTYPPGIPSIQLRSGVPGPPMQGSSIQMGFGMDGQAVNDGYKGHPPRMGGPTDPGGALNYPGVPVGQGFRPMAPQQPMAQQPQAAQKLNPDLMPGVIQVIEDDKKTNSGPFQTGLRGLVPPLVTTDFIVEDLGTCSPRFLRSTMYNIPCSGDMMKNNHLPFVVALTPFAKLHSDEMRPPLVDLGPGGPIRCNRCKAYMCPFMRFDDGGRKFQCCFCLCNTEVPAEYFAHLDHNGKRIDCFQRPELSLGAYEFVATVDYCKDSKLPNEPAFIFMIDVSYSSVRSGLVGLLCSRLKEDILKNLPREDETTEIRIGFVTFAKDIHFYNIKNNLVQPQMMIVTDVIDMFVPIVDGFLVKLSDCETIIDSLLLQISQMFMDTQEREILLGPVIEAGLDALKSSQRPGKLIIFSTILPTAEAPGKLKSRDDRNLLGTDKEKTLLAAQTNYYTKLGQECVAAGCSVDMFLFPSAYIDVATMAEVPRLTGGSLYKYSYFQADTDGEALINDLKMNVMQEIGFDAVLRLRTSTGIRAVDFLGNLYMSNTTDIELAAINSQKCINVIIKHDDKLQESEGAYLQAAILYTSSGGKRRLRILNTALNCTNLVADLFRSCELDALINYFTKFAIRETLNSNVKQVRDQLMSDCANILASYRRNCANSSSSSGQLILPECLKLLPVYTNCILKSGILQSDNILTDDRCYFMHLVNSMSVKDSGVFIYPRLIAIHDLEDDNMPCSIRCSYERLKDDGAYILENGLNIFLWIGLGVKPDFIRDVFGVSSVAQIDIEKNKIPVLENTFSLRIRNLIQQIRDERQRHMKLHLVRQRDKIEVIFRNYLVEDGFGSGSLSYVDFLCHIHKEIRSILS